MEVQLKDQVLNALGVMYGRSPDKDLLLKASIFLDQFQHQVVHTSFYKGIMMMASEYRKLLN